MNHLTEALLAFLVFAAIGKLVNRERPRMNWSAWLAAFYGFLLVTQIAGPISSGDAIAAAGHFGGWSLPLLLALSAANQWRAEQLVPPDTPPTGAVALDDGEPEELLENPGDEATLDTSFPILGSGRHRPASAIEIPCKNIPPATDSAVRPATGDGRYVTTGLMAIASIPLLVGFLMALLAFGFGLYWAFKAMPLPGIAVLAALLILLALIWRHQRRRGWQTLHFDTESLSMRGFSKQRSIAFSAIVEIQTYLDEAKGASAHRGLVLAVQGDKHPLVLELGDKTRIVAGILCRSTGLVPRHTRCQWVPEQLV
jgi:hypothetical protein